MLYLHLNLNTYTCIIKIGAIQKAHSLKIPIFNPIPPICFCSLLLLDLDLRHHRVAVVTTAQLHSTKPESRFCKG